MNLFELMISDVRALAGMVHEHCQIHGSDPVDDATVENALKRAEYLERLITKPDEPNNITRVSESLCGCTKD